ncbi:MAG TPA: intercompartmental signaling factor BofC [Bacillaceae bacterium]
MSVFRRAVLIILFTSVMGFLLSNENREYASGGNTLETAAVPAEQPADIPDGPLIMDITLKRVYMDGETSEEKVKETIWALEDFWAKYESWQLVEMDEKGLIFKKDVSDISPLLKMNGFFGITEDGTLSIFNGRPEDADIIQSFFQIDVEKLQGNKRLQLLEGIPVKSKEDYTEVLETMKQYSIQEKQEKG